MTPLCSRPVAWQRTETRLRLEFARRHRLAAEAAALRQYTDLWRPLPLLLLCLVLVPGVAIQLCVVGLKAGWIPTS